MHCINLTFQTRVVCPLPVQFNQYPVWCADITLWFTYCGVIYLLSVWFTYFPCDLPTSRVIYLLRCDLPIAVWFTYCPCDLPIAVWFTYCRVIYLLPVWFTYFPCDLPTSRVIYLLSVWFTYFPCDLPTAVWFTYFPCDLPIGHEMYLQSWWFIYCPRLIHLSLLPVDSGTVLSAHYSMTRCRCTNGLLFIITNIALMRSCVICLILACPFDGHIRYYPFKYLTGNNNRNALELCVCSPFLTRVILLCVWHTPVFVMVVMVPVWHTPVCPLLLSVWHIRARFTAREKHCRVRFIARVTHSRVRSGRDALHSSVAPSFGTGRLWVKVCWRLLTSCNILTIAIISVFERIFIWELLSGLFALH